MHSRIILAIHINFSFLLSIVTLHHMKLQVLIFAGLLMPTCSAFLFALLKKSIKQSIRNIYNIGPRSFSSTAESDELIIEVDKIAEKTIIEDEYSMYSIQDLKSRVLQIAALTNRGENSLEKQQALALSLIEAIERRNTVTDPACSKDVLGVWDLVYSNTYLFRSSPFFMAARAICNEGSEAETFNRFCKMHREALAFTSIGAVKQIVSETTLRSEFETNVAALPGLPVVIRGTIGWVAFRFLMHASLCYQWNCRVY